MTPPRHGGGCCWCTPIPTTRRWPPAARSPTTPPSPTRRSRWSPAPSASRARSSRRSSPSSPPTGPTSSAATGSGELAGRVRRARPARPPLPRRGRPLARLRHGAGRARGAGGDARAAAPAGVRPAGAFDEQVDALVEVLEEVRPQVVVTLRGRRRLRAPRPRARARDHGRRGAPGAGPPVLHGGRPVHARRRARPSWPAGDGLPFRLPEPDELPSVPDEAISVRVDVARSARPGSPPCARTPPRSRCGRTARSRAFAVSNRVAQPLLDVEEYVPAERRVAAAGRPVRGTGDG